MLEATSYSMGKATALTHGIPNRSLSAGGDGLGGKVCSMLGYLVGDVFLKKIEMAKIARGSP